MNIIPKHIRELSESRMAICNVCEFFNTTIKTCNKCGCFLPAKTKMSGQGCPEKKWRPVTLENNVWVEKQ